MLLSIVIPVYNAAKWLRECLDSCLSQDMDDMEVVCIDDGSTDDSLDILQSFERRDGRVRIVQLPENMGLHMVRKRGAAIARGKYILSVDADDRITPRDGCRKLVAFAEKSHAEMVLFPVKGFSDSSDARAQAWVKHINQVGEVADCETVPYETYMRSVYVERSVLACSSGKLFLADSFRSVVNGLPDGYCNMGEDAIRLFAFLARPRAIASSNALVYEYRGGNGMSTGGGQSLASRCNGLMSVAFVSKCLADGVGGSNYRQEFHEAVVKLGMRRALFGCSTSDLLCLSHTGLAMFAGQDRELFLELATKHVDDLLQAKDDQIGRLRHFKRIWRTLFVGALIVLAVVLGMITY